MRRFRKQSLDAASRVDERKAACITTMACVQLSKPLRAGTETRVSRRLIVWLGRPLASHEGSRGGNRTP